MKKHLVCGIMIFLSALLVTGCHRHREEVLTQLQVREIQTRDFDTKDMKSVMKSMMNVLQDEGFIIKNAVLDLGLLSAEKHVDIENKASAAFQTLLSSHPRWDKQQVLEASANVSEFGEKIRIRMNFQTKIFDNWGRPSNIETIYDSLYYQNFFERVGKGLFLADQEI